MAFLRSVSGAEQGPIVHGRTVTLKIPQIQDYAEWAELRAESRDFLTPWEPTWQRDELSKASFRRRLRYYQKELRDETGYAFFIYDRPTEALLGGLTLSNIRRGVTQSVCLGYWIGKKYAGQGNMSAAVQAITPFVFDTLGLHRLEAACLPINTPSIKLLTKSGFQQEGLARRYLKINGVWQDHLLFALLEDDVRPRH